jgi:hypothetical protein
MIDCIQEVDDPLVAVINQRNQLAKGFSKASSSSIFTNKARIRLHGMPVNEPKIQVVFSITTTFRLIY